MKDFEILFDHGERSELLDPVYSPYGRLGFPTPPANRPWIYANFVQSLDGIVSLLGSSASGADISHSEEDRWLMDMLRAHADGVLLGLGTLLQETALGRPRKRGPVFRIMEEPLQQLRAKLHRGRERNIFVTAFAKFQLDDFAVFDAERVDPIILTTAEGADRLAPQLASKPGVKIIVAGGQGRVDLPLAMQKLRHDLNIRYLLCEGGPILYGNMIRADLIDEKFLTVSPVEVGQQVPPDQPRLEGQTAQIRPTILDGPGFRSDELRWWTWVSCRKVGDHQFNRYRLKRRAADISSSE
ncbi:MAG TPA: dihydrofolate reductase family protein [Clostridia bacterium]|nr:dihydrofolate reductase family protein [Clostridia bacterium]